MRRKFTETPECLRAAIAGRPITVDREKNVIRGYVVAELGPFKTPGRGQFDDRSLEKIVQLYRDHPAGLRSRFTHPHLSDDGLGKFLGRSRDAFRDGGKVRADLHLDPSASRTPNGDLAGYVMDLAESDPDALSSSLVLQVDQEQVLDERGRPKADANGDPVPPIWRPKTLIASDVVDTGDAVNGFLSITHQAELPDAAVRLASRALDQLFEGVPRHVAEARANGFLQKYLDGRFGQPLPASVAELRRRMDEKRREW
jgi:hypothetical protein